MNPHEACPKARPNHKSVNTGEASPQTESLSNSDIHKLIPHAAISPKDAKSYGVAQASCARLIRSMITRRAKDSAVELIKYRHVYCATRHHPSTLQSFSQRDYTQHFAPRTKANDCNERIQIDLMHRTTKTSPPAWSFLCLERPLQAQLSTG